MLNALMLLGLVAAMPAGPRAHPAKLVGDYDGGQMEMAAGLSLKANGRCDYGLAYGARDEEAAGGWTADARQVLLTSDKVTPPRFSLIGQKPAAPQMLRVTLDVPPQTERQFFNVHVLFKDGTEDNRQLAEDDTVIHFEPGNPPVKIALSLDVFDLASQPVTIDPAKGYEFDYRFEPNDLGKGDFRGTSLKRTGADLLLGRYGRSIRFRKVKKR